MSPKPLNPAKTVVTTGALVGLIALAKEIFTSARFLRKEMTRKELTHETFFDEIRLLRESSPESKTATAAFAVYEKKDDMFEVKIVLLDSTKKPLIKANGNPLAVNIRSHALSPTLSAFFGDQHAVMIE